MMGEMYGTRHDELEVMMHYGVKGMKWGVRRKAKKDAKEYARAKMFYGDGAGTRRKLIKAQVESRSKDEFYKSEFEKALAREDLGRHAKAAKRERKAKNAYRSSTRTGRGIVNILNGNSMAANATAVTLMSGYALARQTGADKIIADHAKTTMRAVKVTVRAYDIKRNFHV